MSLIVAITATHCGAQLVAYEHWLTAVQETAAAPILPMLQRRSSLSAPAASSSWPQLRLTERQLQLYCSSMLVLKSARP
jgi:hypothetical protein